MYNIQRRQDWEDRHNIYYTGVYHETINMVEYPLITSISKIYDIDQDRPIGTLYIDLNFLLSDRSWTRHWNRQAQELTL